MENSPSAENSSGSLVNPSQPGAESHDTLPTGYYYYDPLLPDLYPGENDTNVVPGWFYYDASQPGGGFDWPYRGLPPRNMLYDPSLYEGAAGATQQTVTDAPAAEVVEARAPSEPVIATPEPEFSQPEPAPPEPPVPRKITDRAEPAAPAPTEEPQPTVSPVAAEPAESVAATPAISEVRPEEVAAPAKPAELPTLELEAPAATLENRLTASEPTVEPPVEPPAHARVEIQAPTAPVLPAEDREPSRESAAEPARTDLVSREVVEARAETIPPVPEPAETRSEHKEPEPTAPIESEASVARSETTTPIPEPTETRAEDKVPGPTAPPSSPSDPEPASTRAETLPVAATEQLKPVVTPEAAETSSTPIVEPLVPVAGETASTPALGSPVLPPPGTTPELSSTPSVVSEPRITLPSGSAERIEIPPVVKSPSTDRVELAPPPVEPPPARNASVVSDLADKPREHPTPEIIPTVEARAVEPPVPALEEPTSTLPAFGITEAPTASPVEGRTEPGSGDLTAPASREEGHPLPSSTPTLDRAEKAPEIPSTGAEVAPAPVHPLKVEPERREAASPAVQEPARTDALADDETVALSNFSFVHGTEAVIDRGPAPAIAPAQPPSIPAPADQRTSLRAPVPTPEPPPAANVEAKEPPQVPAIFEEKIHEPELVSPVTDQIALPKPAVPEDHAPEPAKEPQPEVKPAPEPVRDEITAPPATAEASPAPPPLTEIPEALTKDRPLLASELEAKPLETSTAAPPSIEEPALNKAREVTAAPGDEAPAVSEPLPPPSFPVRKPASVFIPRPGKYSAPSLPTAPVEEPSKPTIPTLPVRESEPAVATSSELLAQDQPSAAILPESETAPVREPELVKPNEAPAPATFVSSVATPPAVEPGLLAPARPFQSEPLTREKPLAPFSPEPVTPPPPSVPEAAKPAPFEQPVQAKAPVVPLPKPSKPALPVEPVQAQAPVAPASEPAKPILSEEPVQAKLPALPTPEPPKPADPEKLVEAKSTDPVSEVEKIAPFEAKLPSPAPEAPAPAAAPPGPETPRSPRPPVSRLAPISRAASMTIQARPPMTPIRESAKSIAIVPEPGQLVLETPPPPPGKVEAVPMQFQPRYAPARAYPRSKLTPPVVIGIGLACLLLGFLGGYFLPKGNTNAAAPTVANNGRPIITTHPAVTTTSSGDPASAVDGLTKAEQTDLDKAFTASKAGNLPEARQLFTELQKKHPEWASMSIEIGRVCLYQKDLTAAHDILTAAAEHGTMPADANFLMGLLYMTNQSFQEAEAAFAKSTAIDPARPDFYYFWGECLRRDGKPLEAADRFHAAMLRNQYETADGLYRLKFWLSKIQADQENTDDMIPQIEEGLKQPRPSMEVLFAAAARAIKAADYTTAAEYIRRARLYVEPAIYSVIMQDPTFIQENLRPEFAEFFRRLAPNPGDANTGEAAPAVPSPAEKAAPVPAQPAPPPAKRR